MADITRSRAGRWLFLCARPVEPDGSPFDYARSRLSGQMEAGFFEDRFCALIDRADSVGEIVEFDLGSTDMAVFDWIEEHAVPEAILDD